MNGRSIQDIIPPARSKPIRPSVVGPTPPPPPTPPMHSDDNNDMHEPRGRGMWTFVGIAAIAVLVIGVGIALMSTVFHSASASVVVSEWKSDVSGSYTAGGDVPLTYTPVSVTDKASTSVPATGSIAAEDHAFGTIIVSNLYSTKSQRLITNTRFETKDGLIYRTHAPIVVPGYTTKNGAKVAGTVEAVVYADQAGDKYNTGMTTFTIPGLKGSDQFTTMIATSKTPMSGGFIGQRATVEASIHDAAVEQLKADLDRTLRAKVTADAPAGSVVFADSIDISYTSEPDQAEGGNATITVNGTAIAPAFSGDALARELASHAQIVSDAPLSLANTSELTYSAGTGGDVQSGASISFTLTGSAHLVAVFNPSQLATDLAGKTEAGVETVRSAYPSLIGPITIAVYPFWIHTLPTNPDRIHVIVNGALDQKP